MSIKLITDFDQIKTNLRLVFADPASLDSNPMNWRSHPRMQGETLNAVLNEVGWAGAALYNESTERMIDGHLRKDEAIKRGEPIPVLIGSWTEEQERVILATLDPIGALAEANAEILEGLLREVKIDDPAIQRMLSDLATEAGLNRENGGSGELEDHGDIFSRHEEISEKWGVESGQMWLIPSKTVDGGLHRLICGDCTDVETIKRLMGGIKADLFATDPPYLVDYDGTNHPHKWKEKSKNKDWSSTYQDWDNAEQGADLYNNFIEVAIEHAIAKDVAWYCWHASRNQAMLEQAWKEHGAFVHQQIIWVKDRPILTRSWYMWQHEPCFFGWIKGNKPKRYATDHPPSVWQIPTIAPGTSTDHPTSKPVELFAIPIRQHTRPGDICYEPFAGSGTQFEAAEQLGRLCYGTERVSVFCAVILERMEMLGLTPDLAE